MDGRCDSSAAAPCREWTQAVAVGARQASDPLVLRRLWTKLAATSLDQIDVPQG